MAPNTQALCWLNGEIMPAAEASISVLDHGLLYGDGVFEGIRFRYRQTLHLSLHFERLQQSAQALDLKLSYSPAEIAEAITQLLKAYGDEHGYMRLIATRGVGPLGLDYSRCEAGSLLIIADQLNIVPEEKRLAAKLATVSIRRLPADGLDPRIKSLNYLNHILARQQARLAGADEALLLNQQGRVAEGSADNIFMVRKGELLTPPVSEGALAGITRASILELAEELHMVAREIPLTLFDLYNADEVFLTGTGAGLIAVAEIDGRVIKQSPGPIFTTLTQAYESLWQSLKPQA